MTNKFKEHYKLLTTGRSRALVPYILFALYTEHFERVLFTFAVIPILVL